MIKKKIKLITLALSGVIISGLSISSLISCRKEDTKSNSNPIEDSKSNISEKDEIKDQPNNSDSNKIEEENEKKLDEKLERYYEDGFLTKNISEEILKAYKSVYQNWNGELNLSKFKFKQIDRFVFSNKEISSVIFPKTLIVIENDAFRENKIKKLIFPENVEYIGEYAFYNNELEEVIFPKGIKKITERAFVNNAKLLTVKVGKDTEVHGEAFNPEVGIERI